MSFSPADDPREGLDVAIVGMAGRFPGAHDLEEFWRNLRDGVESIREFNDEELEAMGVPRSALSDPSFVKAGAVLDDPDLFDAPFFGFSPREARLLDPQHRVFLECCWEALERAGYDSERFPGIVGVYAGTSLSTYLLFNLLTTPEFAAAEDSFPLMVANDKDFLCTRVSYALNLDGPSVDVQTGCSTSLVAVHLACQGLLAYQADMALAGGVSVQVPQRTGYYHQPGGITSPDGHCRAFDARAEGTIFGSGVGVVVLKRLTDALADGDTVHAVIRGSAVNNDGSRKIGYTAPGLDGQLRAIEMAQAVAGVEPQSVSYVETHGTATALGDPVEVSALTRAFRTQTERRGFCALGAVKTNIGHLDAAAGVAGLIKTVLALEHERIPPSLHFEEPNPRIDFAESPFYVAGEPIDWPRGDEPRRAGVSSFGIGGTNAHVVLEEAPEPAPPAPSREWQVLPLSAKTDSALDVATLELADFLRSRPEVDLADAAFTLQVGRRILAHRRTCLCTGREDAVEALEALDPGRVTTTHQERVDRPVAFLFPGGGAQYVDMARGLYDGEPVFRARVDAHAAHLRARHGFELFDVLYPTDARRAAAEEAMQSTSAGLPALFVVEHALAELWTSWGVRPQAMIGHSLGEYVAACLAGVLSPEAALDLVVVRGRLFEELPEGGMIGAPLPEAEVRSLLGDRLSLAAINGPEQCVVSGPNDALEELSRQLAEREVEFRPLKIDVAAHSHAVEGIRSRFEDAVAAVELRPPKVPFLSNVTGTWITAEEAVDPGYWGRQLRETVRFGDGVGELLREAGRVLLEVGPGQSLSTLVRGYPGGAQASVVASVRHPYDRKPDAFHLADALGRLWLAGVAVDWSSYHGGGRRRVVLPTYPFERRRYWIDPGPGMAVGLAGRSALDKRPDVDDWFYVPSWRRTVAPAPPLAADGSAEPECWLVVRGEAELGGRFAEAAAQCGRTVVEVVPGERFDEAGDRTFTARPGSRDDLRRLLEALRGRGLQPASVVHLGSLSENGEGPPETYAGFEAVQERGLYDLLTVAQTLGEAAGDDAVDLWAVTEGVQAVESGDRPRAEHATLLGAGKVVPQEYPRVVCRTIDVTAPAEDGERELETLAVQLVAEVAAGASDRVVAYRGGERWVEAYEPVLLADRAPVRALRERGVYLITGGLGGVGLTVAGHLARSVGARLVLAGRSPFPPEEEWDGLLVRHGEEHPLARTIGRLRSLQEAGAELMIDRADVSDEAAMAALLSRIDDRFGRLDGVVHAAGVAGEKALKFIPEADPEAGGLQFASKAAGLYVLERVLAGRELDFCLLCSSNASVLGGLGSALYAAANAFMDAFALARRRRRGAAWISANWDGWLAPDQERLSAAFSTSIDRYAMAPEESVEAFDRVVTRAPAGQVVVSTGDLSARLDLWVRGDGGWDEEAGAGEAAEGEARRTVDTPYVPPSNELESTIAEVWQEALGVDRLGIHDNFFDLGGNSLIGLRVVNRLRRELGREIQVVSLFEGPTVSALASLLDAGPGEEPAAAYEESRGRGEQRRRRRGARREASVADE